MISVLDALDKAELGATKAPWTVEESICAVDTPDGRALVLMDDRQEPDPALRDAALICLSRNHLRELIEVARAAGAARYALTIADQWLLVPSDVPEKMRDGLGQARQTIRDAHSGLNALAPLLAEEGEA